MDVQCRWNCTYDMLHIALEYEDAFNRLEYMDKNYVLNPTKEEWKVAHIVHDCLKFFSDATVHYSGIHYLTVNVFFPDIYKIKIQLSKWENNIEECLRLMAGLMKVKFSKYQDECSLCLAIAVILDPRFKMDIIEYYCDILHCKEFSFTYVERVKSAFFDLYTEYGGRVISSKSVINDMRFDDLISRSGSDEVDYTAESGKLSGFKKWRLREQSSSNKYVPKSEFDHYLERKHIQQMARSTF